MAASFSQQSRQRKLIYFGLILLLVCLAWTVRYFLRRSW